MDRPNISAIISAHTVALERQIGDGQGEAELLTSRISSAFALEPLPGYGAADVSLCWWSA